MPKTPKVADFDSMPTFGDENTIAADITDRKERDERILANFARFYLIALDWTVRSESLFSAKEFCELICRGATMDNFEEQIELFRKKLGSSNASARDRLDMFRFSCYWTLGIDDGSPLCGVSDLIEKYRIKLIDISAELDERSEESEEDEDPSAGEEIVPESQKLRVPELPSPPFGPSDLPGAGIGGVGWHLIPYRISAMYKKSILQEEWYTKTMNETEYRF